MSSKIIKITDTTLRDAHQSLFATRFNNDTISELAPLLDNAGYDVLEVWGGATFDSCIRYLNEDPWDRLKMINRLTPNTKLSMLLRGANLVGYKHYSNEIIQEFITVSTDFGSTRDWTVQSGRRTMPCATAPAVRRRPWR